MFLSESMAVFVSYISGDSVSGSSGGKCCKLSRISVKMSSIIVDRVSFAYLSFNMADASSDLSAHSQQELATAVENLTHCIVCRKRRAVPNHFCHRA